MDWTFWYFVGLAWLSLAFLWLPAIAGVIAAIWRGHGGKIDNFCARHGSLVGAIISTGVAAIGVVAAWIAVQSQIASNNDAMSKQISATIETTKIQVEAALLGARDQIEEGRKQHRLEYLRQYLAQLEPAVTWLDRASRHSLILGFSSDVEPYSSQEQKNLDEYVTFLNNMPSIPYFKGMRPAERRDRVLEAIRQYRLILGEPKDTEEYRQRNKVNDAAKAVRDADSWFDDDAKLSMMELTAREELEVLEKEIEYHPKRFP